MSRYSLTRDITLMALLVACNVALELTLGTVLHSVKFPLTGSLMAVLNALVYALAFSFRPRFGRITLMGIATAIVNFIIVGGLKFMVLPAIITEALIIDIALSRFGIGQRGFIICGACASLTSFLCKLFNMQVFRGIPLATALNKVADFGLGWDSVESIVVCLLLYRLAIGALLAWAFWGILCRLKRHIAADGI